VKFLARFVGNFGWFGLGLAAFSLAVRDPRARPLVLGLCALVMGVAGVIASRFIRRGDSRAEASLYVWALSFGVMYASFPFAFPYAFAGRTDILPSVLVGMCLFVALTIAAGRYIRRHRAPTA
jgi:drug/metabolite transporter (DMT)-like permease